MQEFGAMCWVIPEGYIPAESTGRKPEMESHESISVLNLNEREAHLEVTIYFTDKDPVGSYNVTVPARRSKHVRYNNLSDPAPIPVGTEYSSVITSDVPIIVQYTRLDSRQAENALMSTMAFPVTDN